MVQKVGSAPDARYLDPGFEFGVWVWGLGVGFGVEGSDFRVLGSGFRVLSFGFWVSGFRVSG